MNNKGLGRGIGEIFPDMIEEYAEQEDLRYEDLNKKEVREIEISQIRTNPYQPRKMFDPESLEELSASIREHGVLQPILVRQIGNIYELIAGERRLQASQKINLETIPALILETSSDEMMLEVALIENIQRENLNPIEEAKAYHQLNKKFGMSHQQIAQKLGKSRTAITNLLRLLNLPESILDLIEDDSISLGHAKVILGLENPQDQEKIALLCIDKNLSVRELEQEIKKNSKEDQKPVKKPSEKDPFIEDVEKQLIHKFGTKVEIRDSGNKGNIAIHYYSLDDLNRIINAIRSENHA